MTESRKFQSVPGVRDILPPESALWNRVEQTAREVSHSYGFAEILLPVFEHTDLFARSVGDATDIVSKEMYTFEDRGSAEIDSLKDVISIRTVTPDQPVTVDAFVADLKRFRLLLNSGVITGGVPTTGFAVRHIAFFNNAVDQFLQLLDWPEGPNKRELLDNKIQGLKALVFTTQTGDSLSLRPEATASVVRAYIEHGMHSLPGDVKLFYLGPMFRRERPQKGRYRQFHQFGVEVLGQSDHPGIDADVIELVLVFIERCGLIGHTLHINSIGCKDCRPQYVEALRSALIKVKDKLGPDSQRRIETNPLRVLDSKLESEQALIETLPRIADHLCEGCREHFKLLQAMLFMRQIAYEVNWRLVRGLDYYMRTTFEITAPGLGSQNAVCGGGRYDGLVELLGGPPTKGMGFALGTDRLILALQEAGKGAVSQQLDAYIAWMGANAYPMAVRIAHALRAAGISVELPHDEMKFKKSLGLAARLNARFAIILGDNEVAAGTATVKRMSDATQETVGEKDLGALIRS